MTRIVSTSESAHNQPVYLTGYTARMTAIARSLLFISMLSLSVPASASAALLYISPTEGVYGVTDTFLADVRIDNQGECINAAHVEVRYPVDTLRAVDFSKGNSILSLWVEEPKIDTRDGVVTFSGGIPGGYCGRIPGDPVLSNVLGKIVFSVIAAEKNSAVVSIEDTSVIYMNDGLATPAALSTEDGTYTIQADPLAASNPWLTQVGEDKTPPDEFVITVESTSGVFRGNYYAVFATQDKQSGLDHYEIFERDSWRVVTSPHQLKDQLLVGGVQIKAIDKAGNERLGTYIEGSAAPRVPKEWDSSFIFLVFALVLLVGAYAWYQKKTRSTPPSA